MYAVGRLGSYITRGVYTVSGPFHPFGGAVDIIVVEQQDGSFKSSPWYVRFGKFQGVLKAKEKVVNIDVNGVQADFHMYLDHKGEAYFLKEVDGEEGDSVRYPSSSGEDTDGQSSDRRPVKSKTCNYDASQSELVTQIGVGNAKILTRTNSRRSHILGLVFGRKSMKENGSSEGEDSPGVNRADSLERAEIAADLLEVNWSTNLASRRPRKGNASQFSGIEAGKDLLINDVQGQTDSPVLDNTVNSLDHPELHEEIGSHGNGMDTSDKDFGVGMSCLNTEHIVANFNFDEGISQENSDLHCQTLRGIDELGVINEVHDERAKVHIPEITSPDPDSAELNLGPSKNLKEEQDVKRILLADQGVSEAESVAHRVEVFVYSESLGSSRVSQDDSGEKTDETFLLSCAGGAEVYVLAKTLDESAELISEVNSVQEITTFVAKEALDIPVCLTDGNSGKSSSDAQNLGSEETSSTSLAKSIVTGTYAEVLTEIIKLERCSKQGFDSQECRGGAVSTEAITDSSSERSEEEQLLGGDLDDFSHGEVKCIKSISSNLVEKERHCSVIQEGSEAMSVLLNPNDGSCSSLDMFVQENAPNDVEDLTQKSRIVSSHIVIPRSNNVCCENVGRMVKSLPNMRSPLNDLVVDNLRHSLGHSLDSHSESSKWIRLREDVSSHPMSDVLNQKIKSDAAKEDEASQAQPAVEDAQIFKELEKLPANLAAGDPSKAIDVSNERWGVWPFTFQRSRSMKNSQPTLVSTVSSDAEKTMESSSGVNGEEVVLTPKVKKKKKVRTITPTPEQLASLNLKEGKNIVTFTFSTSMLGQQQVDARIYLWKWDTRVVISDVDGTITKSDVLGQFMPLVGMDWSQTGVAHLFSAIKENGYQLLFLSARAISQAYHTRQFLFNLKQDGKALPDGPVVISPDGLFPSLFREVIRRAPHEFKISCLEDIRAIFPSDCNPFYAGFGNRDTDEISYLKVGIPKGKIFIINPKGEVAVNRRVDTKSYTSLHALVHDMFPPMSSSEQEDFNSWNFWKLPHPGIDVANKK